MRLLQAFKKASKNHPFIAEEVCIIEDDEISYCKSSKYFKDQTLHVQPHKVNVYPTQEMANPQQQWSIYVVKPTQDEEDMSDETLLLRYHR